MSHSHSASVYLNKSCACDYDLVFIVTCVDSKSIVKMLSSVLDNNIFINVLLIFINQTSKDFTFFQNNNRNTIHEIKRQNLNSSKARNIGINYLLFNNINFYHIMFPDDDSLFTQVFFKDYIKQVHKNVDYLIDVYCVGTDVLFKPNKYSDGDVLTYKDFYASGTVNMVVCYRTFIYVGYFDERFGVGAQYGAGEDYDYFIRATKGSSRGFIYNKKLFNYHPSSYYKFSDMTLYQIINKYVRYGSGTIFVLAQHKMYKSILNSCIRAIGGAIFSLLRFDIKLFIAYSFAFFSRAWMFIKCIANLERYH